MQPAFNHKEKKPNILFFFRLAEYEMDRSCLHNSNKAAVRTFYSQAG
jgi:hypothetical protein